MKLSHYVKTYPYREKPGYLLFFSTKRASKILLPEETFQDIENNTLSPFDQALLSKLGMIVEDTEKEKQEVLGFFDSINEKNRGLNIIAALNLDCNFACQYCFEGEIKGDLYMSNMTAELLTDFIRQKFTSSKKSLLVGFYGGEPLLSIGLIRSISRSLNCFIETRDASYSFTLVTNGSLFTRQAAEELVMLGLKSVQITLDGPPEIHNRTRPFMSGAGSFDTIINNIRQTCDIVKINISGNFEKHNYEQFVDLLDLMDDEGLTPDRISSVKFAPVMKRPEGTASPADFNDGCMTINEPWLVKAEKLLRGEILRRGYYTPKLAPMPCAVEITDSYVVNFDGNIYKCPAFIGNQDFAVGNLETGIRDYDTSHGLDIWKNRECRECRYLPLCFGGCRYMTFVRAGNIDSVDCKKDYFDASLETLIKQDTMQIKRTSAGINAS